LEINISYYTGAETILGGRWREVFLTFEPPHNSIGVYLYQVEKNIWEDITPSHDSSLIKDRTGHCCIPISHGLLYFGGLVSGMDSVSADVLFLDLFSSFPMEYNEGEESYQYCCPDTSSPITTISTTDFFSQLTETIGSMIRGRENGRLERTEGYCPLSIVER
jgi:hypothetical protein